MIYDWRVSRTKWSLILLAVVALVGILVLLCSRSRQPAAHSQTTGAEGASGARAQTSSELAAHGQAPAPLGSTVHDRAVRDRIREQIHADPRGLPGVSRHAGTLGPGGELGPAPASSSPTLDRDYIRQVIREDFAPMAKQCYEHALAENPKLAGKLVVFFTIVGDDKIGGVVESAKIDEGTTIDDAKLQQCFTESMMSIAFKAPPRRGWVTVKYPFMLSPDDEGPDAGV